jgi:hypothetical protein
MGRLVEFPLEGGATGLVEVDTGAVGPPKIGRPSWGDRSDPSTSDQAVARVEAAAGTGPPVACSGG